jgi:hypothetical protein
MFDSVAAARRFCLTAVHRLIQVTVFSSVSMCVANLSGDTVRYQLEVDNTWSEATHPGAFPGDAHFSWFGGGTHTDGVSFWEVGQPTSAGMTQMAETGRTDILVNEVASAVGNGDADQALSWQWWFCPDGTDQGSYGATTVEFDVDDRYPLVTLVSMLGPSPDWFVGVTGLPLHENGRWLPYVEIDLRPFDGGTRSANRWQLFGPQNNPPEPITEITHESGQLVGPDSLGTMTFRLQPPPLPGDANLDGFVDASDFNLWNDHRSESGAGWHGGDFNRDGMTNSPDFQIWVDHRFQANGIPGQPMPVPESTSLSLLVWLVGCMGRFTRRVSCPRGSAAFTKKAQLSY